MSSPFETRIEHLRETSSTNAMLQEYAAQGAEEGLVLVADHQTEGRGKPGNKWLSVPGKNLLFSLLLRPPISPSKAPMITQVACRSVATVLKANFGIESTFKRPNDVLVAGKKICGVLVEASSNQEKVESIIIGIGLNVNAVPTSLAEVATCIQATTEKEENLEELLRDILTQLQTDMGALYASGH